MQPCTYLLVLLVLVVHLGGCVRVSAVPSPGTTINKELVTVGMKGEKLWITSATVFALKTVKSLTKSVLAIVFHTRNIGPTREGTRSF